MSTKQLFNNDWLFKKQPLGTSFEAARSAEGWTAVTLPHDWLIYDSNKLYENGEGWYRKTLHVDEMNEGEHFSLYFEGVYMDSTLYVNGQYAGEWKYGYSSFEIDITPYVIAGENDIIVRVVHQSPNSRWYSGAGIYRSVWLMKKTATHLPTHGVYIATKPANDHWIVEVDTEVRLAAADTANAADYRIEQTIMDAQGAEITSLTSPVKYAASDSITVVHSELKVQQPKLWKLGEGNLYTLETRLYYKQQLIQRETERFGFRSLRFTTHNGFFLNNEYVKIFGACQHHDLGALGSAVNRKALRRQIELLQEMGVNAIRTAHNMPAVELMELADEMGVLICSEAFDMWERPKTTYDYARFYRDWWQKDITSWVRRDRNHPSLIMWSIGNEIYDTHADERGQVITRELMELVEQLDYKRNAVVTIGSNYMPWENAQKCADIVKVAGYNYGEKYYDQHHELHPDWIIYGSETASVVQSRGVYHFPLAQAVLADDDEQCSALGNSSTSWGAKSTEACIIADRDATYSLGQFIWTGFDYIGEPTPYHTKNSYFGQLDTAGFKKDSFYIYQAEWTDYRVSPMVHIFPYWDFSEGQLIDVRVCSNAPKIELFFNDVSQGIFHIDHQHGQKLVGDWQIPYEKGVLRAVAYNEHDEIIATDTQASFGDAVKIVQHTKEHSLLATGSDLAFIEISTVDENGQPVHNANNRVHLSIDGPGRLVGLDNGDSTDYDSYKGTNRRLFNGKLLAIVASTLEPGEITVTVRARGLKESKLTIVNEPAPKPSRSSDYTLFAYAEAHEHNFKTVKADIEQDEIPVRKIEIIAPQGTAMSADATALPVSIKLHPQQATYQDVVWRLTNAAGVDANMARLDVDGHQATIHALGDGELYIRCGTKNGKDKLQHYAMLDFSISGIGQAFIDPYEFVSAGYNNERSTNLSMGNERGVATARDGESIIYFEKVDFGSYGSDEVTLPIFSLDSEAFTMELWEGYPSDEDAVHLGTLHYHKQTKWNVYQPETYKLNKRLKGITSLALVLKRKIHLKGFQFTKLEKAYQQLGATEYDQIYGDSFSLGEHTIENIGNNVSIIFEEMDFNEGARTLTICGHSPIDKNTITIIMSGENGDSKQLVEFAYSDDYTARTFELEPITGKQKLMFVFLPGSQFNLKWFKFEK